MESDNGKANNKSSMKVSNMNIMKIGIVVIFLAIVSAGAAFVVISTREDNKVKVPGGYELFETEKFGFAFPTDYMQEKVGAEDKLFYTVQPKEFNDAKTEGVLKVLEYSTMTDEEKKFIENGKCEELGNSIFQVPDDSEAKLTINYENVESYKAGKSYACEFLANAELLGFNIYEQSYYIFNKESGNVVSASISYKQDETPSNEEVLMGIAKTIRVY